MCIREANKVSGRKTQPTGGREPRFETAPAPLGEFSIFHGGRRRKGGTHLWGTRGVWEWEAERTTTPPPGRGVGKRTNQIAEMDGEKEPMKKRVSRSVSKGELKSPWTGPK